MCRATITRNLHNAMWPGLVGKGPDSEPPIDLDTMLKLTAAARAGRRQVRRRRSFSCRSAHLDRFVEGRRQAPGRQDRGPRACGRIGRCAGVAADGRRLGDGIGGRAQAVSRRGREGLPASHSSCATSGSANPASCGSIRRPACTSGRRRPPRARRRSPRLSPRPATSPSNMASGSRRRAKSAGAACTAGSIWSSFSRWSAGRRRSASRPTWRTPCSTRWATTRPRTASCRKTTTGRTARRSTALSRRSRTRCGHGRSTSTSRRTTRPSKATGSHDKTGRHCMAGDPNGKLDITLSRRLLAARRQGRSHESLQAHLLGRLHVPELGDDEAEDMGRHSGRDGRRARRARLGSIGGQDTDHGQREQHGRPKEDQRRHGRLRLHGPDPFERVRQGQPVLRSRLRAGAQGRVRTRQGESQGFRRRRGATNRSRPTGAS